MTNYHNRKKVFFFLTALCFISPVQAQKQDGSRVESKNGEISYLKGTRKISGIYPHLTTYAHGRLNGVYDFGNECGIGALAAWNDQLYMINYAAHQPLGSEHKLYIVDEEFNMKVFEGSIGGTPAARLIHQESNQLLLGPYVIDSVGNVRVIPYTRMKGRLTAYARHLYDPENMVYMYDMDGMLYEVNVYTLAVNRLFEDPLPGWHGKGAYTSQGRLLLSNNGERTREGRVTKKNDDWENENYQWVDSWKIAKENVFGPENIGILAEFDGADFKVVERRQYTDITTKNGINAVPDDESPLWAVGWDKKSIRLKMLDKGNWSTYLLPKAAYNNDPPHGWFTEWPRIRSIGGDKMMMDMHGMFFDFPSTFSASNTSGIRPMSSHLRYVPDFANWNGQIVLATDETSVQGNPLAGQPQSNLWFGSYQELSDWGPKSGYCTIWADEEVLADVPSPPLLIAGFDHRLVHFFNRGPRSVKIKIQIDTKGNSKWKNHKIIQIGPNEYQSYMLDTDLEGEWIRLIADTFSRLTAAFHFTDSNLRDDSKRDTLFSGLADVDYTGKVSHSKLFSNRINFNLRVYAGELKGRKFIRSQDYDFTKFNFNFEPKQFVDNYPEAIKPKALWTEDKASVIVKAKGYTLRLPKGHKHYSQKFSSGATRSIRELESERELANICGTFYEVPLYKVGQEPLYKMLRPVATHNKQITDYNTWNGLLVLSGVRTDAMPSNHIYKTSDGSVGIWLGGIDDLWSFGKPVGEGGPWKDSEVRAGELSDMYLMTGYDKKTLKLKSDKDVNISVYLHVNHYLKEPLLYKTFQLKAGEDMIYKFPDGFSAHWVQLKPDADCVATAWFLYE